MSETALAHIVRNELFCLFSPLHGQLPWRSVARDFAFLAIRSVDLHGDWARPCPHQPSGLDGCSRRAPLSGLWFNPRTPPNLSHDSIFARQ